MGEASHILVQVVSNPKYRMVLKATMHAAMIQLGLAAKQTQSVTLAVDEAVSNVIRHGYKGECERPIWLKITPVDYSGKPAIRIVIEDECSGTDLSKIKGRPLEEYRPGGLGVHIIQGVMDFVEYAHRRNDAGVRLTMIKCIQTEESEEARGTEVSEDAVKKEG